MIPKLEYYKEKWGVTSDTSIKPGLQAIEQALRVLGNPEKNIRVAHVAGTNGKGSTIAFMDSVCLAHGLSVGKFMSPCIIDVHDQLQINQQPISESELDAIFQLFAEKGISGLLTDFELLTCAAFVYFSQKQVDVALIETGMGGRYDSTNVVDPIVSVITSIAVEHTNFLGKTLEEIAFHKAGIVKTNCPVVVGQLPNEALQVVMNEANKLHAPIHLYNQTYHIQTNGKFDIYSSDVHDLSIAELSPSLLGEHQKINMAMAITAYLEIAATCGIAVHPEKVRRAIEQTALAGRFEEVYSNVYFEGAHNPASIQALTQILGNHFSDKKVELIIGMLKDKDVQQVLQLLEPLATKISFIDIPNERALPAQQFYELSNHPNKEIVYDAVNAIQAPLPENTIRIVTGSLYLLADLREKLR